eukprot:NODE_4788_length_765_cov_4.060056_g3992_i0.p1 GENE.NODE_4788_length_765_cov_4.060056_g3992_i0~~NODE_4788_length_765_cov_4.060056_g3992_i0.p1  ORF type:complete len:220 (-),score=8.50 NODE_4788_length_765_cov_4.060056_g3992_i0:106-765(-)
MPKQRGRQRADSVVRRHGKSTSLLKAEIGMAAASEQPTEPEPGAEDLDCLAASALDDSSPAPSPKILSRPSIKSACRGSGPLSRPNLQPSGSSGSLVEGSPGKRTPTLGGNVSFDGGSKNMTTSLLGRKKGPPSPSLLAQPHSPFASSPSRRAPSAPALDQTLLDQPFPPRASSTPSLLDQAPSASPSRAVPPSLLDQSPPPSLLDQSPEKGSSPKTAS